MEVSLIQEHQAALQTQVPALVQDHLHSLPALHQAQLKSAVIQNALSPLHQAIAHISQDALVLLS